MKSQKVRILQDVLGQPKKEGSELLFKCPKCNHPKKKLSINLDRDVWKCWICGYSGHKLRRVVRKWGTNLNVQEWNEETSDPIPSNFEEYFHDYFNTETEEVHVSIPEEFTSLTRIGKYDLEAIKAYNYLKERGLTREDILRWKIGFCPTGDYEGRIIIPSFRSDGRCNYFIARSYTGHYRKYKNPKAKKEEIVFNELYVDWSKDLILTEGAFDAIVAGNSVPLLGSSLNKKSKLFHAIVVHDTPIYIALDFDAENLAWRMIKDLLSYDVEVFKIDTSGYEDVACMPREVFLDRKESAQEVDRNSIFLRELELII